MLIVIAGIFGFVAGLGITVSRAPIGPKQPGAGFGIMIICVSMLAMVLAVIAASEFNDSARWRTRALRRGRCPNCGYDIRMHPGAGARCPECGEGLG